MELRSPQQFRQQLQDLLSTARQDVSALAEHLERTGEALARGENERLEAYFAFEMELLHKLDALHTRQRGLLERHGFGTDRAGLEGALDWCEADAGLRELWHGVRSTLADCRRRNHTNARLVQQGQERVGNALDVLRGVPAGERSAAYGPTGVKQRRDAGRPLGRA